MMRIRVSPLVMTKILLIKIYISSLVCSAQSFFILRFNALQFLFYFFFNLVLFLCSGICFLDNNLNFDFVASNSLQMNTTDSINASTLTDNRLPVENVAEGDINKPWIDLRLVLNKDKYVLVDMAQKDGENLINSLHLEADKEKPDLINTRVYKSGKHMGIQLDNTLDFSLIRMKNSVFKGAFIDINFRDATITSYNLPVHRNDEGSMFIIQKKNSS